MAAEKSYNGLQVRDFAKGFYFGRLVRACHNAREESHTD